MMAWRAKLQLEVVSEIGVDVVFLGSRVMHGDVVLDEFAKSRLGRSGVVGEGLELVGELENVIEIGGLAEVGQDCVDV